MNVSAQNQTQNRKIQILIVNVSSYLGQALAESFLEQNCSVFGVGNSTQISNLLDKDDFTLLEIDRAQPLPSHLPSFDYIIYISKNHKTTKYDPQFSIDLPNLISYSKKNQTQTFFCLPLSSDSSKYEPILKENSITKLFKILLIGDLYGPKMNLINNLPKSDTLQDLIEQAIFNDKIILEHEGLNIIYPTYISDAIFAINRYIFSNDPKETLVVASQNGKTALSIAYEIQNIVNLVLPKQIGLFFTGPQEKTEHKEPINRFHFYFEPKIELTQGLTDVFESLKKTDYVSINHRTTPKLPTPPDFRGEIKATDKENTNSNYKEKVFTSISKLNIKKPVSISIILILFVALTILKTGLDIFWGTKNLQKSKTALEAGDFAQSGKYAKSSYNSFIFAQKEVKILTFPFSFLFNEKIHSINNAFKTAAISAQSTIYFINASEALSNNFENIINKNSQSALNMELPSSNFKKSYTLSSGAIELSKNSANIPFSAKLSQYYSKLPEYNQLALTLYELTNLTESIIGKTNPKSYLVLFQNNTELRPGGGFIGSYATIEFDKNKLKDISVDDIYNIDGQLVEKIEPPAPLKEKLGVEQLYLRDSNWSGDFAINAQIAQEFYRKETGKSVDGVIAIDLLFIQNLLKKTGSINLPDYNEAINSDNLFEKGEYYSEVGFTPGSTQKKDFFSALTKNLIDQITANPKKYLPAMSQLIHEGSLSKDIMISLNDPQLSSFVQKHNWDHPLPPRTFDPQEESTQTRDFLAILEANVGANKVNRFLDRKIKYEMTIGRDADLVAKLTINYTNNSQANTWPAGKYVNYLRIYTPLGASLFEYSNGQENDLKTVETTSQNNLTVLSTYVEVPIKSTKEVSFTYRIPKNIKLESAPFYHLYVQKQAGTLNDPIEFIFNLPNYLIEKETKKQNLNYSTELNSDKEFNIEITKK